jgi:hypothetical protein
MLLFVFGLIVAIIGWLFILAGIGFATPLQLIDSLQLFAGAAPVMNEARLLAFGDNITQFGYVFMVVGPILWGVDRIISQMDSE